MHKTIFFSITLLIFNSLNGQQNIKYANLLWVTYNNTILLNKKWSIAGDIQIRTRDWAGKWSQFGVGSSFGYKINKHFNTAGGIGWFGNVRYFKDEPVVATEWRFWQEIAFHNSIKKTFLLQRVRLEQRFLQKIDEGNKTNNFEIRNRFRYKIELGVPLFSKRKIDFHFGNEIMINVDHLADNLFFDQYRLFAFVNFKLSNSIMFQCQYYKVFQWQAANQILENQNVFRCSINQQIKRKVYKHV